MSQGLDHAPHPASPAPNQAVPGVQRRTSAGGLALRSAALLAAAFVLTLAGMALAYSVVRLLES